MKEWTKPAIVGELNNAYGSDGTTGHWYYGQRADSQIQTGISYNGTVFSVQDAVTISNTRGDKIDKGPDAGRYSKRILTNFQWQEGRSRWCDRRYDPPRHYQRFAAAPVRWTGGIDTEDQDGLDRCPKRNGFAENSGFTTGSWRAVRWDKGVSLLGLDLKSRSGYSRFVKTHFSFGTTNHHYICGGPGDRAPVGASRLYSGVAP